jgi:hypothetical protein
VVVGNKHGDCSQDNATDNGDYAFSLKLEQPGNPDSETMGQVANQRVWSEITRLYYVTLPDCRQPETIGSGGDTDMSRSQPSFSSLTCSMAMALESASRSGSA